MWAVRSHTGSGGNASRSPLLFFLVNTNTQCVKVNERLMLTILANMLIMEHNTRKFDMQTHVHIISNQ